MREHEVPTHVQAEDKVLLWFTFPQIVAVVAVCALAYGAFHYLPFGPMAVRLGGWSADRHRGHRPDRGQDRRPGAAAGGRRPAEVQPGGQALRRVPEPTGAERATGAGGNQARPAAAAGQESGRRAGQSGEGGAAQGARPLPAPQLVRQAQTRGQPGSQGQPARRQRGQGKETLVQAPGRGRSAGRRGGCHSGHGAGRRPRRRGPGLAAGRDLLRAAGPGAGTPHLRGTAGGLRRHRRRHPAGGPRPGPEGAGLRRQDGEDPEDGREVQPSGPARPGATT